MSQHINPTPKQTDVAALDSHLGYGDPIADCNSQMVRIARTNSDTLNTPYKQGLTQATEGLCIQAGELASAYKQQVYMEVGGTRLFIRREARVNGVGTWDAWEQLVSNSSCKSYVPTISGGSGFTVSNVNFTYLQIGKALFINGRFNVTNIGSEASSENIRFSLPDGLTCYDIVGSAGHIATNEKVDTHSLSVRQGNNQFYIQQGAGGLGTVEFLGTGYIMVNATIMLA